MNYIMRQLLIFSLLIVQVFDASIAICAQEVADALQHRLLEMLERDQAVRRAPDPEWNEVAAIDHENQQELERIIADYGWPLISEVGELAASAAALTAIHATENSPLQEKALELLREAASKGEASWEHVALLTDKMAVTNGELQTYGTQGLCVEGGRWQPEPVAEPEKLEEQRASIGLPPIELYAQLLEKEFCQEDGEAMRKAAPVHLADAARLMEIRIRLLMLEEADQQVRRRDMSDKEKISSVDLANQAALETIIDEIGWPSASLVGEDAASAAVTIAIHADETPSIQHAALRFLEEHLSSGEVDKEDYAALVDSVAKTEGRPQTYGTQGHCDRETKRFVPYPIADDAEVDARRAEMGLEPIGFTIEMITEFLCKKYDAWE